MIVAQAVLVSLDQPTNATTETHVQTTAVRPTEPVFRPQIHRAATMETRVPQAPRAPEVVASALSPWTVTTETHARLIHAALRVDVPIRPIPSPVTMETPAPWATAA